MDSDSDLLFYLVKGVLRDLEGGRGWGVLGGWESRSRFLHVCNPSRHNYQSSETNSTPFQRYCFMNYSVDPQIHLSLFSFLFKRSNIFSFIDFLTKILHHNVPCGVVYIKLRLLFCIPTCSPKKSQKSIQ